MKYREMVSHIRPKGPRGVRPKPGDNSYIKRMGLNVVLFYGLKEQFRYL